ncbi:MAG: hypothetical protein KDL31_11350, partial [Kiritimatiellae bacterium]|nr:hypothetical protein [Kiritimatiellia bacterium]
LPAGAIIPEAGMTTVVSESVSKEHLWTLPAGAIIPEAGMTTVVSESVSKEHLLIAGGILVVLVLVGLVVSGIKRLIVLGLAVLFLVFSVNLLRSRWHHVAETFPEVQARIDGVLEQAAANPELAAFASEIQQEATRMLTEAGDQGAHAAGLAYQKITDAIAHEIETRSVAGQREAVDALSRLQQGLQEAVGDNPTSAAP